MVDWCLEQEVPVTPGVATPTEIEMALDKGLKILKFFPAEALGGVGMLKAIAAAYGGVSLFPRRESIRTTWRTIWPSRASTAVEGVGWSRPN